MTRSTVRSLYLGLVIGTGAVICSFSLYHFIGSPQRTNPQLLILTLIALALGSCLTVRIPRLTSQITVSDTFIFLTMLLYGGDAAILLATLEAFCSSLRFSRQALTIFSNAAMLACATFLTSVTLSASFGSISQLPRSGYSTTLMVALCLMALVQYIVNSGLVAIGVALKLERPLLQTWSKHYLWTSITYVAGASAAGIIARLVTTVGFYSVIVTAPIVAVIFLTYRTYRENIERAGAQAEQSERHAKELSLYIDERRRAEEERSQLFIREQQARAEAEEASRMKDEFLAMVSHELRTPLTPILGWIRMLSCDEIDRATSMEAVESIQRAAKYQESIINDLLDVSRITRGKLNLEMKQIHLMHVVEASLEVVRPAAEAKDILINCTHGPARLLVSGDPGRLKQVMWNILSNAVKFTPIGGRIDIEIRPNGSYAEIQVRDNGVGIHADFLPYVFERFRQADGSNSEALGGLGLGLALVKYLTEMHGGSVKAESLGIHRGATFTMSLPLLIAPQSPNFRETLPFENRQSRVAVPQACAEEAATTEGSTYPMRFGVGEIVNAT